MTLEHYFFDENIFGNENWFGYPNLYKSIVEKCNNGSKIVEVGSWMGRSASYMAVEIANSKKDIEFYCVDTWNGGPDHQGREELSRLYDIFLNNMRKVEKHYFPLRITSLEAAKKFKDNSLDFVFIDASHEYEDVKNDILAWLPKVKPGGILAGHDYYPEGHYDWFPGVKKAVKECLDNFETSEGCFIYKKPIENNFTKVLFFGRSKREELLEYDFIVENILSDFKDKNISFLSLDEIRKGEQTFDVFVYSARDPSNYSWGYMPTYDEVLESVLKTKPKIIIQLSDEFFHENLQQHNELGNYCELFLRQHHHPNYEYTPNTLHIPLGYYNDFDITNKNITKIRDRNLNWCFVGYRRTDREECINKFSVIEKSFVNILDQDQPCNISKKELVDIYLNSIFSPGTRGWTNIYPNRLYESSICGSIPIVVGTSQEILDTFKYEQNPPWIFSDSWDNAVEVCKNLLNDIDQLQKMQDDILKWWDKRISSVKQNVNAVLKRNKKISSKLENFPPINFISIKESEDRRSLLYKKFEECGLTNITPHIFEKYKDEDHKITGSDAELVTGGSGRGPLTSHLKAIKTWYETTDEPYAFFCEDDISFETVEYWNFTWQEFFDSLPNDWNCVQLSWIRENMFMFSPDGLKLRTRCWCDWSAAAYLISRKHAESLISLYCNEDEFVLEYRGVDRHLRPESAYRPIIETMIFSNVGPVYGFPLFVEDTYNCNSTLSQDIDLTHRYSHDTIINWWKENGKKYDPNMDTKLKDFPHINFISIQESSERRKILTEKLKELKLKFTPHIFEKYKDEDHKITGIDSGLLIGPGRGPLTSHLKAIKTWYETTDEPYAFFCEDDISFETVEYWNFTWQEFFDRLPSNWECVQLTLTREFAREFNIEDFIENIKYNLSYFFKYDFHMRPRCWCDWSCVGYFIKRSHAKKLIDAYYSEDSFCLEYKGVDRNFRPEWAYKPVAETIIYSLFDWGTTYTFPLFVENSQFETTLSPDNNYFCVRNTCSITISDWWKNTGKDFSLDKIIDKSFF